MKFNEKLVHIFPFDEERIMLDINTGLVHSLDQMTYAFTELWRESKKELAECRLWPQSCLAAGRSREEGL